MSLADRATVANMALDGLQDRLLSRFKGRRVYLVRYADDFIITSETRSVLSDEVMVMVKDFLRDRGLELAEEKTRITPNGAGARFRSSDPHC